MDEYKIGDLVKPSQNYAFDNKHTAAQCNLGVVVSYRKVKGNLLYKIFWWPSEEFFSFEGDGLELMSRVFLHEEKIPKSFKAVKRAKSR
jgi:hypothetical protein